MGRKTFDDRLYSDQATLTFEPFFLFVKEVLGGVILRKYANNLIKNPAARFKKWEQTGLIDTHMIAGNQIIRLRRNQLIDLSYTPTITPSLILRSCLRMEKYVEKGLTDPQEMLNEAMRGGDRARFRNLAQETLKRIEQSLKAKGYEITLYHDGSESVLNQLQGRNIYLEFVRYNDKDKLILKPNFSYYLVRQETAKKVSKELLAAYREATAIFGTKSEPRFTVYSFGRSFESDVYKALWKAPEFLLMNKETLKATFAFKCYKRPFTYIEAQNIV